MKGLADEASVKLGDAAGIDLRRGSIRPDGRVILFVKGKYPGAHASGYALRSRVIWWLHTGEILDGLEFNLHHINHDRADDRLGNLERLGHIEHAKEHNPPSVEMVQLTCRVCGGGFEIKKWRLNDKRRGKYCGWSCSTKARHQANREKACA